MLKVIEMTVNGKRGYYTGLQSNSQKQTENGCWVNGFRITDRLEKIPKSGRFMYRFMDWGNNKELSRECWWSTFPNELEDTVKMIKDWSKLFNITDIRVLDVNVVQTEKLELSKSQFLL